MPGGPGVNQLNLTPGVTRIAADQWWIHNFLMIVCLAIFVAVFAVMFYSLYAHRKSRGHKPRASTTPPWRSPGRSCRS